MTFSAMSFMYLKKLPRLLLRLSLFGSSCCAGASVVGSRSESTTQRVIPPWMTIVNATMKSVTSNMTWPCSPRSRCALTASAKATAPLNPQNHKRYCVFGVIGDFFLADDMFSNRDPGNMFTARPT